MANKPKQKATLKDKRLSRKEIPLHVTSKDDEVVIARKLAKLAISPEVAAYRVIAGAERKTSVGDELDVPSLLAELQDQVKAVNEGNLVQSEAMLMNQATALQSLFALLAARGMGCDQVPGFEANMKMALRAQSQCRATLETLAEIKNPMTGAYVRQANIAAGHQQVNNGAEASRAGKNEIEQSKQLEAKTYERLDTGTKDKTIRVDSEMATVGKIKGT